MADIGYHASHEQHPPGELLSLVQRAEQAGFEHVLASDHFHPWSPTQGESAHVWSWLGAALQATSVTFGTVNCPAYRYHPAVVAQAAASLRSMYPERFWLAIGSGQLLNEGISAERWPPKPERNARLREAASVVRDLWSGEEVTHYGRFTVEAARLYTRPASPPPLFGAALSEETARWIAGWADGLITLTTPDHAKDAQRIQAFREKAPDKPIYVKAQHSYARDEEAAIEGAMAQWATNCIPGPVTEQLRRPEDYAELASIIDEEDVRENVRVSADPDEHVRWLEQDRDLDVDRIYVHNVNTSEETWIDDAGEHVLPALG